MIKNTLLTTSLFIAVASIVSSYTALADSPVVQDGQYHFVTLKDFTKEEVKGIGFTLTRDSEIDIQAVGGGSKSAWIDFSDETKSQMYAAGWIINADTREVVWEMTMDNTDGKSDDRKFSGPVSLKKGSYEVYFSAHGFIHSSTFNYSSVNIDRRRSKAKSNLELKILKFFDDISLYDEFMEFAKDRWFITLSVPESTKDGIALFDAPKKFSHIVFAGTGVGDKTFLRKSMTVTRDVSVKIYAIGEGRKGDDTFDYGWIINNETRDRVWQMTMRNCSYAGGSSKNIVYNDNITLRKGSYELYFITDDSHSREDWNAKPPYDPFNYGITLSVGNAQDENALQFEDYSTERGNIIVELTKVGNDEEISTGFELKTDAKIRIYALGEGVGRRVRMADYGWITNEQSHKKVWEMEYENTVHAGGASKNRMADEVISLSKGRYIVHYITDDSHAYNDWNSDEPYDPQSWGITVYGVGDKFTKDNVSLFKEEEEKNVIAQLIKVRDNKKVSTRFTIAQPQKVRVYALGEADGTRDMADYGWIENAKSGKVVWEMTYGMTERAGGAKKNRVVDSRVYLEAGEYVLHYRTDDSHAYGDWNDDAPEDRLHWGITIYQD